MSSTLTFLSVIWYQLTFNPKPPPPEIKAEGETAIVTGSNVGLGFEAAKQLASRGLARLILAVRDISKGEVAKAAISRENPKCQIEVWQLDQDSWDSMSAFARKAQSLDRLDILLLNAGMKRLEYTRSPAGHETHIQVNHLSTALLSLLLLAPLRKTAAITGKPSRMTITASILAFIAAVDGITHPKAEIIPTLDDPVSFKPGVDRYCLSKLLNILWTRELAKHVDAKELVINMCNPGWCMSEFHREDPGAAAAGKYLGWSSEQGAHLLVDAALQHPESHGEYLSEQRVRSVSGFVLSAQGQVAQKRIWDETLALLREVVGQDHPIIRSDRLFL
ncbi:NAD(P)-binding protein [Daldinia decipiens]|uniref:NAD(P)-binding protein n=1 Tax=Daldinia decipiens TaxID=326647 RepID=UPI0020C255AE|nr:NAD(P)-binding protein [Daldinia decipiens]KAI1660723.1 NAD(P)-binding protein [Daldinia decipiens]